MSKVRSVAGRHCTLEQMVAAPCELLLGRASVIFIIEGGKRRNGRQHNPTPFISTLGMYVPRHFDSASYLKNDAVSSKFVFEFL